MELERALVPNIIIYEWLPHTRIFLSFNAPQDPPSIPPHYHIFWKKRRGLEVKERNSWK